MKSPEEIGKLVRELRGDISLREFAKKCVVSHTTIDNIEKGYDFRTGKPTQIKLVTLHKIADACGVPISYFTGEKERSTTEAAVDEEIIKAFNSLSLEKQKQFRDFLRYLLTSPEN